MGLPPGLAEMMRDVYAHMFEELVDAVIRHELRPG